MALNVTTAVFRPGFNIATASPSLVQWDQGQTLQFEGVELPSAYQVEFTNAVTVQAITMIGNENGVEIPNELLQQSFPINAYIVLHETAEDRETEYWATIYVKARQKPREETPDPEQSSVIDQTIAALQEGVAEAQAASQAVQNMGVEAETLPEGSAATVEKTVDPETGEVTLEFGIPEGRHGATGATPDIQIGTVTTGAPGSQADASITGTREEPRLNLTIPQGPQGDAGVISVNGKTGAVTLDATDVGAKPASYEAPVSSVNGKTGAVVLGASDVGAKPASYEAPVSSVNGKTGAVVLSASDVGAKPASYEAPVSSVNEKTGAVVLDSEDIRYDSTETYSDGTVGKELGTINSALSSLSDTVNDPVHGLAQKAPIIINTASGDIASFADGADDMPIRKLVANIVPKQDLHGYANPWPAGGNVNLLNPDTVTDGKGLTNGGDLVNSTTSSVSDYIPVTAGATYYLSYTADSVSRIVCFYDSNKAWVDDSSVKTGSREFTVPEGASYCRVAFATASKATAMVNAGSTALPWSPYSNECPITGWTGVTGQRTGVNVFDAETELGGRGAVEQPDGSWYFETLSNIPADTIIWKCPSGYTGQVTIDYLYKNVNGSGSQGGRFRWVYSDGTTFPIYANVTTEYARITNTSASGKTVVGLSWDYGSSVNSTWFKDFQVELSSTASPYEEYTGEAISVSWQTEAGTVYDGYIDIVSGDLYATYKHLDLSTITLSKNNDYWYSTIILSDAEDPNGTYNTKTKIVSDTYRSVTPANIISKTYVGSIAYYTSALGGLMIYTGDVVTPPTGEIIYPLAEPIHYTLSAQQIDTLYGQNNVWADVGSVSVEYPADTKLYIDKKIAELAT